MCFRLIGSQKKLKHNENSFYDNSFVFGSTGLLPLGKWFPFFKRLLMSFIRLKREVFVAIILQIFSSNFFVISFRLFLYLGLLFPFNIL